MTGLPLDLRTAGAFSPGPAAAGHPLPRRVLLRLIAVYQRFVSPVLPVVTLGTCSCRFHPSCSRYAAEAIGTHGAAAGVWLAVRRLVKTMGD